MNEHRNRFDGGKMVGGLILIGIGILFLLDQLHIASFGHLVRNWWPVIPMLVGLTKLFRRDTFWGGAWLIAIGVWLMIASNGWYGLSYGNSWPLLLIVLGGGIILRSLVDAVSPRRVDEPRA